MKHHNSIFEVDSYLYSQQNWEIQNVQDKLKEPSDSRLIEDIRQPHTVCDDSWDQN